MPRLTLRLVSALAALVLLLGACSSSDDSDDSSDGGGSTTSTTEAPVLGDTAPDAAQDYCDVVRANPNPDPADVQQFLEDQVAVAPAELESDLEALLAEAALFEDGLTEEERAAIDDPLRRVVTYQVQKCGIPISLGEG